MEMVEPGAGLRIFINCITQDRLYSLNKEKILLAKADLSNILKDVTGAEGDNVRSLRSALRAVEERDYTQLELIKADAIIDYETLMIEYNKGPVNAPKTRRSRELYDEVDAFSDLPRELSGITKATQELEHRKRRERELRKHEEKELELLRQQEREMKIKKQEEMKIWQKLQEEEEERQQILLQQQHLEERQQLHEQQLKQQQLTQQQHTLQEKQKQQQQQQQKLKQSAGNTGKQEAANDKKSKSKTNIRDDTMDPLEIPRNLAERFTMLYETEWKAAMEDLSKEPEHKDGNIKLLADIVEACFQYCKALSTEQFQEMWERTIFPMKEIPEWLNVSVNVQKDTSKSLRQYRQDTAMMSVPSIQMMFTRKHLKKMLDPERHTENILNYASKCVELTWLFNIQSPPMCFLWARPGQKITGHLTVYEKLGELVQYNVWPTLLTHQGGSVLCKGIVQPHWT